MYLMIIQYCVKQLITKSVTCSKKDVICDVYNLLGVILIRKSLKIPAISSHYAAHSAC